MLPYDGYRVGPFQGLTVRLSGLSAARKAALAGLVAGGGGVHSPALDKKCTHLVTVSTQSEKYKWVRGGGGGGGGRGGMAGVFGMSAEGGHVGRAGRRIQGSSRVFATYLPAPSEFQEGGGQAAAAM